MKNHYDSYQDASNSNWSLLKEMFSTSKRFKLIKPKRHNSVYDGILATKKDGKDIIVLIEVKRRQFTSHTLHNDYKDTLFLEKDKYKYLHKARKKFLEGDNREVYIWYLSKTSDGYVYLHDLTDKDFCWVNRDMNEVTYVANPNNVKKYVTLLPIKTAFKAIKTNILN